MYLKSPAIHTEAWDPGETLVKPGPTPDPLRRTLCAGPSAPDPLRRTLCAGPSASDPLRRTLCVGPPASDPLRRTPCVGPPAPDPLRRTLCVGPSASDPLRRTLCAGPSASDPLRRTLCVGPSASDPLRRTLCAGPSASDWIEIEARVRPPMSGSSSAASAATQCPICASSFSRQNIAAHAAQCGLTGQKRAATLMSPSEPVKRRKLAVTPLAEAMRPTTWGDWVGQEAAWPAGGRDWAGLFEGEAWPSLILWGPPGCGKTSWAHVLGQKCQENAGRRFVKLSACTSNVAEVKEVVRVAAHDLRLTGRRTVLFIDEVHRFNKLQQDAFLPHVEKGTITLIGATTENPSYSLNSALLSRCQVLTLAALSPAAITTILTRAMRTAAPDWVADDEALVYLAHRAQGDARTALNALQLALASPSDTSRTVRLADVQAGLQRAHVLYDRKGDQHFHCASALQKSIRGSDDNAALYWTMRMLQGGEDPLFIARRLVRIASEDVGLGDPQALNLAVSTMQGCQLIGAPECDVLLAQCSVYLARARKSHEILEAMGAVKRLINDSAEELPGVPLHLRNPSNRLAQSLGYGDGYSHDLTQVQKITYMPESLTQVNFFPPAS
eukprot:snap_masked-scaffold743_size103610-processed-gene-0.5 protein:Tk01113 transcript:snap_masked-scaffold743_size103610-processed-gene-0.5-mRNA-1 annotation:"atpase wrnip1"